MSKKNQRHEMLALLNRMERHEHKNKSLEIMERLVSSTEFRKAEVIAITISRFPEVDTRPVIEAAWKEGKRVAVPKCIHTTHEMDFRLLTSYDNLEKVYMDLWEPIVADTQQVIKDDIDVQIVPGVLYSDAGYRIGFGGGYYDRYLTDFRRGKLSLAFDCQTGQSVPVETHDVPVHKIFTEQKVIDCKKVGFKP